jgi:hypothetical protein
MKPTDLLKYWSTRPLDKNQFFHMIHRDYFVSFPFPSKESQLRLLKDFLYQSNGQLPAIKDFSADDDSGIPGQIEFLIYFSPLLLTSLADIDTSYNPFSSRFLSYPNNLINKYTGISSYGFDDEDGNFVNSDAGIEIEFERFIVKVFEDEDQENSTQYSLREYLQDSQIQYNAANYGYAYDKVAEYIQLEYTRLKDYPILNHPGGIR